MVNNAVKLTYLEGVLEALRVNPGEGGLESVSDQFLDLRENVTMEVKVEFGLLSADNLREVLPAELVAVLKLAIVIGLLLDRIVRQVDKLIGDVVQAVLATARSNVPVLVAVPLQAAIDAGQEPEASKIELSLVDQQWVIDVLLNYERPVAVFFERASDD